MKGKKIKILGLLIIVVVFLYFSGLKLINIAKWNMTANAISSSSFPYEIGLMDITIIPCSIGCNGACCIGGTLCTNKTSAECTSYSDVSGISAGGDGNNALFSTMAITESGLSSGGELIAGGMSMIDMDSGVLASDNGCYGCIAQSDGIFKKMYDYSIALFKK